MKPTPQQIRERNEAWARALEANPKKCVGQMRDGQGGRCCLAVAEDVALAIGMPWPSEDGEELPRQEYAPWRCVSEFFGWGHNTNSNGPMMQGKFASHLNDGRDCDAPNGDGDELTHAEIAKLVRETFCKEGAE